MCTLVFIFRVLPTCNTSRRNSYNIGVKTEATELEVPLSKESGTLFSDRDDKARLSGLPPLLASESLINPRHPSNRFS